jgi:hypothetical protein
MKITRMRSLMAALEPTGGKFGLRWIRLALGLTIPDMAAICGQATKQRMHELEGLEHLPAKSLARLDDYLQDNPRIIGGVLVSIENSIEYRDFGRKEEK